MVLPVEIEIAVPAQAFQALKMNPQASALSFRDGLAHEINRPPSEVVIAPDGVDPPFGDFALTYDFESVGGDRRSLDGRALQSRRSLVVVEFIVAVKPEETDSLT